MANIFFTVVGTGNYTPDNYCLDGDVYRDRFVQKALLSIMKKQGKQFDKIVVFLTDSARAMNWEKFKRERRDKNGNIEQITDEGLQPFLEREFPGIHEAPYIPDGNNDEEIMDMFMTMYDHIGKEDKITFDITHGFRFIPLLFYPVMSYAKELKNITIEHIYYGLHQDGKENSDILDLKRYYAMLECAKAAHMFMKSGNSEDIEQVIIGLRKISAIDEKKQLSSSETIATRIKNLTNYLLTCRGGTSGKNIWSEAKKVSAIRERFERDTAPKHRVFNDLITHALKDVENLSIEAPEYKLALNAVKWYEKRGLIMQAYTALREGIVSYMMYVYSPDHDVCDDIFRQRVIEEAITTIFNNKKEKKDEAALKRDCLVKALKLKREYAVIFMKIVNHVNIDKTLKLYNEVFSPRNGLDHFGMNRVGSKAVDKQTIKAALKFVEDEYIQDIDGRKAEILTDEAALALIEKPGSKEIFVNFSNHPSANWSSQQVEAAKALCGSESANIVDIQFPAVPADADEKQISALAAEYTGKIAEYAPAPVMCMGEWGVCCEVVRRLKEMGITVVYSCSERVVTEVVRDGKTEKTSQFNFVRFRKY